MRYFPAFFDLKSRPVFVVGDGEVAARKLRLLVKADPSLHVFSVSKGSPVDIEFGHRVQVNARPLESRDFAQRPALVVAAADDLVVDDPAAALARANNVPVNVVDQPDLCDFVVPSIVDRGDLAIGISTGGQAPVVGRRLRERLEAMLPQRLGEVITYLSERRSEVAESVPKSARRGFWERLLNGSVTEAVLNDDIPAANAAFRTALGATGDPVGVIHIVGAGPGDPELLTLKALRVLQEADIVLYDNLVGEGVLELIRRDADRVYVGKRKGDHAVAQPDIGAMMVQHARAGLRVVRLKGGDPYVFGRGGEEMDAVTAAGLTASVVPGITAATGCAAAANLPLTHRGLSQAVTFVTAQAGHGNAPDINWDALARLGQTVVVYMGVGKAGWVADQLLSGGMAADMPVAILEKGTLPEQRIIRTRLNELGAAIGDAEVVGPALLVIGEVAARASGAGLLDLALTAQEAA